MLVPAVLVLVLRLSDTMAQRATSQLMPQEFFWWLCLCLLFMLFVGYCMLFLVVCCLLCGVCCMWLLVYCLLLVVCCSLVVAC